MGGSEERKVKARALVELFSYVEIVWKMGSSTSNFQPFTKCMKKRYSPLALRRRLIESNSRRNVSILPKRRSKVMAKIRYWFFNKVCSRF